jgi:hypothetical protein
MNGKGDKWRDGTNLETYRINFDKIFRSRESIEQVLSENDKLRFEADRDSMSHSEFLKFVKRK